MSDEPKKSFDVPELLKPLTEEARQRVESNDGHEPNFDDGSSKDGRGFEVNEIKETIN